LCPSNSNKTIGLFGYFNHSGDVNKWNQ
jgi:hypothetical protein